MFFVIFIYMCMRVCVWVFRLMCTLIFNSYMYTYTYLYVQERADNDWSRAR